MGETTCRRPAIVFFGMCVQSACHIYIFSFERVGLEAMHTRKTPRAAHASSCQFPYPADGASNIILLQPLSQGIRYSYGGNNAERYKESCYLHLKLANETNMNPYSLNN